MQYDIDITTNKLVCRFLQLPFTVYQELLLLIRSNPEGIKDVLNLRLVHSKTKDWVDGLSSQSAGKVFTNVKVVINFQEHETDNRLGVVQKFLDRPPEYPVFGLKLIGVTHFMALKQNNAEIHVDCCGGESLFSVSDNQIWKKFCEFWKEKLVYFESDNVDDEILPIDVEIGKLINSQSLEEYHCYDITRFRPEFVPDSWWKLQVIRVDFISLPSHELPYLFNFFSGNDNLRLLILKSIRVCDLVYLIDLFRSFGDRKQLKIIIWFHFDISHLEYNRLHEFSLEEKRILVDFATMVANTSYCVILKLMEKNLLKFLEDSIVASMQEDFLKSIDWISFFHVNEGDLDLTRYINLRKVNALEFQGVCDVTFPNKLVHLGLVSGVPATFPVSLSCLHLMNIDSSVGELLILVEKIGKNCPKLVCIDLSWKENEKTDSHSGKTMEREILANNYEGKCYLFGFLFDNLY